MLLGQKTGLPCPVGELAPPQKAKAGNLFPWWANPSRYFSERLCASVNRLSQAFFKHLWPAIIFLAAWLTGWPVICAAPAAKSHPPALATPPKPAHPVFMLGSETLARSQFKALQGKRIGLLTNPSAVNRRGTSTIDLLRKAPGVRLMALFAAEHGLRGDLPAGKEFPDFTDPVTKLPVFSLYGPGPTRKPTPAMLRGLDALVYDLQDTGCRSYTFISTMGLTMESCAEAGVEFIVLDRPNPLGGLRVEGPILNPQFKSLVGQWPIPYAYGMTCGELARMINKEGWIKKPCKLTVIPLQGWRRDMTWQATGLKWVPTSPHIPRGESPLYYVSSGVLGSVGGVSIGFEVNQPFELVAAPWLDQTAFTRQLERYEIPGTKFRPLRFEHHQRIYQGARWQFTDPARAPLLALNLYFLDAVKKTTGRDLLAEAQRAGKSFSLLDKVLGTDSIRKDLERGRPAKAIIRSWKPGEETFQKRRQKYLIY